MLVTKNAKRADATGESDVSKATIYQFTIYDIVNDETRTSRRWATRDAIQRACGQVLENTAMLVDVSILDGNGMTERDVSPKPAENTGFQRVVS
jgi:hypothetical protein